MKKQFLFLVLFVLAVLAGINNSYGQNLTAAPTCATPVKITCLTADTPLNPIPGNPYDYEVTVTVPSGTPTFTYDWFVTTDKNFLTATNVLTTNIEALATSTHIAAIGTGTGYSTYHTPGTTDTGKIKITWQSFIPNATNPVFLVIYVKNTATCKTDNIQVYKIEPQPAFTLDVNNLTAAGADAGAAYATCVSPIVSAIYDPALDSGKGGVQMIYGENYLYYSVTAANFNHSWLPTFQVSPSTPLSTGTIDVSWAYKADATANTNWHSTTAAGSIYTSVDPVNAPSNGSVGSAGDCIVVRVHIVWNHDPNLTDNTINFAVDGIMKDPAATAAANYYTNSAYGDLQSETGANCGKTDSYTNDKTTQIINARPTLTPVAPTPLLKNN